MKISSFGLKKKVFMMHQKWLLSMEKTELINAFISIKL